MSKDKKRAKTAAEQPTKAPATLEHAPSPPPAPVGQMLFDMPYTGISPRLIKPELGLHNLVSRAGHNAAYDIDVTLLDSPDHRLIRSGVLLAHRVVDERGEWYLGAPAWEPLMPTELIEPMGHGDLPEAFADLVRPFRRRAALGPVAALTCERREFALRDDHGTTLALVRDDKVTVRRGGLTTARFREVMLTPTDAGLTAQQGTYLVQQLTGAGGTQVQHFPRLVTRLGAPATGLTDFPVPEALDAAVTFAAFVSSLLALRLRQILEADLGVRGGDGRAAARLHEHASRLRSELAGLSAVLDPAWSEDLDEELEWLVSESAPALQVGLKGRLRGERYLTLVERLVTAARAPKVGDASTVPAADVLESLIEASTTRARKTAGRVRVDSPLAAWEAVAIALVDLDEVGGVVEHVLPRPVRKLRDRLAPTRERLDEAVVRWRSLEEKRELAEGTTPEEAFDRGRAYEQDLGAALASREHFVDEWSRVNRKLR